MEEVQHQYSDNLRKIYDKSVKELGLTDSYEQFSQYFNASDENRRKVYDKAVSAFGLTDSYEDFLNYAGYTPRVDVSDVEQGNVTDGTDRTQTSTIPPVDGGIPTVTEAQVAEMDGQQHYQPRVGGEPMKTPEQLEAEARETAGVKTPTDEESGEPFGTERQRFAPSWGFERSQRMQDQPPAQPAPKPAMRTVNGKTEYDFSPENLQGMKEFAEGAYIKAFDEVNALMPDIERSIRERALFDTEQNNRNKSASQDAIQYHADKLADHRIKQFRDKIEKEGVAGFDAGQMTKYLAFDDEDLRGKIESAFKDKDEADGYMQAYRQSPEWKQEQLKGLEQTDAMLQGVKQQRKQNFLKTVGGMFGDLAISGAMAEGGMSQQDQQQLVKMQDDIRKQNSVNMAVNQQLHQAENTLGIARKNIEDGEGNMFVKLGRGVRYADLDNLIPVSELYGQMGILQLYDKLDENGNPKEQLTDDEQTLYNALAMNQYVQQLYGDNVNMLNRIGKGLPEQAMFTLSFLLGSEFAGAQTIGRGTSKVVQRGISDMVKRELKTGLGRFMLDKAIPSIAGMGAETLYRTGLQPGAVMSNAIERHVGTLRIDPETGEVGGFEGGVDWGEAAWKSFLSTASENATELLGDQWYEPGWAWIGRNTKAGKRIADFRKTIGEIGDGRVDDILKLGGEIREKAGYAGVPFEILEEETGAFNDAAFIHDHTWEEAFSKEALMETSLNCLIFGMAMSGATNGGAALRNLPSTVATRNEKRKAAAIIDRMDGIGTNEIDEHINNDTGNQLADWLVERHKAGNSNGDWTDAQRAAVANYVRASVAQKAQRHFKGMQLREDVQKMEADVDEMTNNRSGNVIDANFEIDGQKYTGKIIGGRVSSTENDVVDADGQPKKAYTYNPYLSSATLSVIIDGTGEKKMIPSRAVTSINDITGAEQFKSERAAELTAAMQQSVAAMDEVTTVSDIWGVDLQGGVVLPYNGGSVRLDGKDADGNWVLTSLNPDGTPTEGTPPIVVGDFEFRKMGMIERLKAMQQQGASEEEIEDAVDDINTEQTIQNIEQSGNEDNIWDNIAGFMQGYTKINEEGDFIPEETRPEAAAGYLVALQKGDIGKTIGIVDARIAELQTRLMAKPEQVENNGEGVVGMAANQSLADSAADEIQKQIGFLEMVRDGLVAKQEEQAQMEAQKPVSQMEVGQEFPVVYDGQQAVAVVVGKDADGRNVVTIRDQEGNDIESGIDDMTNEQWEAVRVRPQEVALPTQQTEQQESAEIEQNAPEIEQKEPENEHQEEVTVSPAQQTFDGLVQKYGDKAGHKIDVTAEDKSKTLDKAKKALEKAQTDYDDAPIGKEDKAEAALQKAQEEYNTALAEKQEWDEVKSVKDRFVAEQIAAKQAAEEERHAQAVAEEEARRAEEERKAREREATGANNVAPNIREKWEGAPRVEGNADEITLANGERIAGHYVLVESGAASASHDALNGFAKTDGFPLDENEQSVNDRDYERDKNAQQITRQIANEYDSRALQDPVVVSQDGVVLSGNGRTMAGEIAAAQNTDGAYVDYLKKYAPKYGFAPEQVEGMTHPRVVFVPDASMPYTAETFAKFNQQEMKGQSKTEQAVKLGKLVDDATFGRIIRSINRFDTLGDFYADTKATADAIGELLKAGAINQMQHTEMFDGDAISAQGREILENMLIGKAFESNPDAVRQLTAFKSLRQSVITALAEISNNIALGEYSLESELSDAIALAYNARKNGYKAGDAVSEFARQGKLFETEEDATAADYTNATVLMLADVMNDNRVTRLKKVLSIYNQQAEQSAAGQTDLFAEGVKTQQEILNEVLLLLQHGTESEQQQALDEAREQRKAAAEQGTGVEETGDTGESDTAERGAVEQPQPEKTYDELLKEAKEEIADITKGLSNGLMVSEEESAIIQQVADMYEEAESALTNDIWLSEQARLWLKAKMEAADKWLDENVRGGEAEVVEQENTEPNKLTTNEEQKISIEDAKKVWENLCNPKEITNFADDDAKKAEWTDAHFEEIVEAYIAAYGNKLDPDELRNAFTAIGYDGSNVPDYKEQEKRLRDEIFDRLIKRAVDSGNPTITILTGVGGAGKSTATEQLDLSQRGVVFDSALNDYNSLEKWIIKAKKAGVADKNIQVVAVHNDALTAFKNTLKRGVDKGRFLALQYFDEAFRKNQGKIAEVRKNYPEVEIICYDNSGNLAKERKDNGKVSVDEALNWNYTIDIKLLNQLLDVLENDINKGRFTANQAAAIGRGLRSLEGRGTEDEWRGVEARIERIEGLIRQLDATMVGQVPTQGDGRGDRRHNLHGLVVPAENGEVQGLSELGADREGGEKELGESDVTRGYTVTPKQYTTKRGKVLDMQLVKFDKELTKEQQRAANALARDLKGWWSREDGGFMMRDEATAQQLIDAVMEESGETLQEAAPLSLADLRAEEPKQAPSETTNETQSSVRKAFDSFYSRFCKSFPKNEKAILVNSDKMSDEELVRWFKGLGKAYTLEDKPLETAEDIRKELKENKTDGYHIRKGHETIAIFIDEAAADPEQIEETLFHEHIHNEILRAEQNSRYNEGNETDVEGVLKRFYDQGNDDESKLRLKIAYGINEKNLYNEYFTHHLAEALAKRNVGMVTDKMPASGIQFINELLADLGYITVEERNENRKNGSIGKPRIEQEKMTELTPPGPLSEGELGPADEAVAAANEEVDTNPTEAQKEAGNYKKGHVTIDGFDISIENPAGSTRSGTDAQGNLWSVTMHNSYGYIRMTEGVDGDHIDIFLSDHIDDWNGTVYVVDQVKEDGSFDEHKVMYGFNSAEEAREAYLSNYSEGWQGLGTITGVSREEFKKWVDSSHRKTKAFADYKSVQTTEGQSEQGEAQRADELFDSVSVGDVFVNDNGLSCTIDKKVDGKTSSTRAIRIQWEQQVQDGQNGRGTEILNTLKFLKYVEDNDLRKESAAMESRTEGTEQQPTTSTYGASNKIVSQSRYEELKRRMQEKLGGQMNMGIDPEILAIGTEMAVYHIEAGARKFADFCKNMVADLGDAIRPYLKSFYNAVRDLPEVEEAGYLDELTPYEEVKSFDVNGFDKGGSTFVETAQEAVKENEVAQQAEEATEKLKQQRKERKQPQQKKKVVSSQPSLFGEETEIETKPQDDGLQRNDVGSSEGLPAHSNQSAINPEGLGETEREEGGRADRGGQRDSSPVTGRPAGRVQELRNTHNNHAERGTDYAPKGVDARIEANIKAIELMQQLIESGEQATPEQMAVLRQFSGWGGLGKAFQETGIGYGYDPAATSKRLRALLGDEAYEQANMSRNSAYYTPAEVIDTLWDIARAMGFKGGNVLEGSAGIGNIIGLMPTDMSQQSSIHAVEIDQTTGNILSLLYPDARVEVQGFEATQVENGSVDLAITNVPFVTGLRVNDTTGDKDLSRRFHDIHDFCIAKNIRKLREGGIGIFITSSGTLDNSAKLREWIVNEGGADVVGAFRMNNATFGGTGVTSDIIVVRKRVNGKKSQHAIDVAAISGERVAEYDTGETKKVKGQEVRVVKQLSMDYNKYFIEHPEMMAGEMQFGFERGETFRPTSKALYPTKDKDQSQMLADFVRSFEGKEWEAALATQQTEQANVYEELGADVKEGSMLVNKDGVLCVAQRGKAVPLEVNANKVKGHTKVECFNAYQAIKQTLADVLSYQTENESDDGLQPLLDKLNKAFDSFVKTYGNLHKNTSITFLKGDVDWPNILALEKYSESNNAKGERVQSFGKTDIFSKRVVEKEKEPEPKNVKDGIIASIYMFGRVDVPYISEHIGMSEEEVREEIVKEGLGFENPATRQMEVIYEYLSGNVREKLQQAKDNNTDGRYDANIKALERVIPMNIPAHLIDFTIGSSWVDPKLYEEYVKERTDIDVRFAAAGGTWFMKAPNWVNAEKNRAMGVVSEMLHKTIMGTQLIEAAMQNKTITVSETRKKYDGTTETTIDKEATQACAAKIDEIRQDFKDWARAKMQSDPEMSERMGQVYNELFNNYVPKEIPEEFAPLRFSGMASVVKGKPFSMNPHQAKAAIRATTQPLLLAHEVGSGKTITLIATAMEMRRLGTAKKPMIVVQNSTVGQFVESAKQLYPNAKVLTIEEADRTVEGRKNFYAKIKYNDWDMIVVPQSVFERIPDSEERQMAYVQDKIEEKLMVLEQMRDADDSGNNMIVRQAEREISQLEDQLAGLSEAIAEKRKTRDAKKEAVTRQNAEVKALEMLDRQTDDVENFDDMGIDAILVDEAHEYKHLGFATAMQRGVKGVDPSYSKKAQGVFLKAQAVLEKNNGRNVVFATGTPISNTAAEIWTFMRYLMPADTMKQYGIYYFDDFVRNFGNLQQMLEFTTSGKFKENNRFAGYVNLPELVRIWSGVADTVLNKDIEEKRIKRGEESAIPELEGGKAQDIYLPQTKALRAIMKYVKGELERFEKMSGKDKKANSHIPLVMYGIAKAAAVDARLVDETAEDDPNSKTNEAVRQTLRSLEETKDYRGTVAIFADNYQNKVSGFNIYEDIRKKLIEAGVPESEVVVMKSGMSDKKKLEIFDKMKHGEVRVMLGSTFTLGTGVNIQDLLHTLIHLDAPNRPMDYTQRNGRILRQGNLHKKMGKPVRVLRFGVEDSLDVTAYQRLKTKGAIADSIMHGKDLMMNSMENRVMEEEEDVFGDTVAQLSGSEYAMLKNQAEKELRKLQAKRKQWEADQTYVHNRIPRLQGSIRAAQRRLEEEKGNLEKLSSIPEHPTITIGKHTFKSLEDMAYFIKEYNAELRQDEAYIRGNMSTGQKKERTMTVNVGGIDFKIHLVMSLESVRKGTTLSSVVKREMTYECPALGMENVPVHQMLFRNALEDILTQVVTGVESRDNIESAQRVIERDSHELEQLKARDGKPFEFEAELKQASERLEEYTAAMKKEMEEKEAKYADMDSEVEAATGLAEAEEAEEEETPDLSIREEEPPVRTGIGYKVFVLKDGKLYPPMVANPNGEATPVGVWLDADAAPIAGESKTGRPQVKAGGKGTQGGSGQLAYRPGWHLGTIPYAIQFNRKDENGEKTLFPKDFVWAEVEYADDVDYQQEAESYGVTENGKYRHSYAGLPRVPKDGSYTYRTNPNPETDPWIITGAMKVKRILTPSEVDEMVREAGREPQRREAGAVTDEEVNHLNDNADNAQQLAFNAVMDALGNAGIEVVMATQEDVEKLKASNRSIQDSKGTVRGWVGNDGRIYLTSDGMSAETPIHEYTHLWAEALQMENPELWEQIKDLLKDTPEWKRIASSVGYKHIRRNEDRLAGEVLAHISGKKNAERMEAEAKRMIDEAPTLEEAAKAANLLGRMRDALKKFWTWVGKTLLGKKGNINIDQVSNMVLADLTNGIDPFNPNRGKRRSRKSTDVDLSIAGPDNAIAGDFNRKTGYNSEDVSGYVRVREELLRSFFDGLRPLEQMQQLVEKALGRKLRDSENAYGLATLLPSLNKAMMDKAETEFMLPVLRQSANMMRRLIGRRGHRKMSREEAREMLNNYLLAKHGLERNEWFYQQALANDPNAEEEDKAGLRGLAESLGRNPDDYKAVAEDIVSLFESYFDATEIDDYWATMKALTDRMLEISYESGMINKDTFESLKARHQYYVPLRGFADGTSGDLFDYVSRHPHFQSVFKKMKGRKSKADDPLANLYNMLQSAIVIGNNNKVMQNIYNMAVNAKSDLLRVNRSWYVHNDATDEWEERFPDIPEDATADEIDAIMKQFDADMQQLKQQGKAKQLLNKMELQKRVLPYQAKEHEMTAYINGRKVVMHVAGNPLVAQQFNKANTQQLGAFLEEVQTTTRWYSAMQTSWSPAFMFTNAARDIRFSLFSSLVTGGLNKTKNMVGNMFRAGWVLPRLILTGKMGGGITKMFSPTEAAKIEQWWNEFLDNGGETGFTQTLSAEKAKEQVDDMIRRMINYRSKDGQLRLKKATLGVIETMGRYSEDISRFAAYCLERSKGETVKASVNEAKNVTVNFNVKGGSDLAARCRACYSFFNASLQGINRIGRLAKEHPKSFALVLAVITVGGAIVPWLNMAFFAMLGGDDDDWEKYEMLSEYTANHNLIIFVGNHKFLKIPYSQELAPFNALGNIWFRQQMGWNHGRSIGAQTGEMFLELLPVNIAEGRKPVSRVVKTIMPSVTEPIWEVLFNENFTGSPIYKDNNWNKYDAGWEKAYESRTSKWLIDASRYLEEKNIVDVNPAIVEHLMSGVLGGIGRSGDNLMKYFSEGFQMQNAPYLRTIMFDSKQQGYIGAVSREYGRLAYEVLPEVKHDVDRADMLEFARMATTVEYKIANKVSAYKTGNDLLGNEDSERLHGENRYRKYKKTYKGRDYPLIKGIDGMNDYLKDLIANGESEDVIEDWKRQIAEEKILMLDEIQQVIYEHSGEGRKGRIDRVKEIEKESKEKAKKE